jgi:hypothetical protein
VCGCGWRGLILMRKLAREAIIFALLGMLVGAIGIFVTLDADDRREAGERAREAVHASMMSHGEYSSPMPIVQVPLSNGTVLQVRQCEPPALPSGFIPDPTDKRNIIDEIIEDDKNCTRFPPYKFTELGGVLVSVPLGSPDQIAIEKSYWTAYKNSRHHEFGAEILGSLFIGLWGFPAGLALWIFYRIVRFAVKG